MGAQLLSFSLLVPLQQQQQQQQQQHNKQCM
jgi:hypothetical protein